MSYLLQPLLNIRAMREDRAAGELTAARQAVRDAEAVLAERKGELEKYLETKEERRDRIYAAVIGHTVSRDQLDMAAEGVARIDEEGVLREDNVKRAEADLRAREKAEDEARVQLTIATKNRMKNDEHRAVWLEDEAKAQEARAEGELEDFTVRKEEI